MTDDLVIGLRKRRDQGSKMAAARIEQQAATIARLEGERDRQVDLRDDQCRRKLEALSRAESAEAMVAALVEALRRIRDKRNEMDMGDLSADEAITEADDIARAAIAAAKGGDNGLV